MSDYKHYTPPVWASTILRTLVRDSANTPVGDYEKFFTSLANEEGLAKAYVWYLGQLVRLVPEMMGAHLALDSATTEMLEHAIEDDAENNMY